MGRSQPPTRDPETSTVLVGYDESEPATRAVERGADLAWALGARLVVASVAATPLVPDPEGRVERLSAGARRMAPLQPPGEQPRLDRAADLLRGRGVDVELVPAVGDPAEALLELADETDADVIVVGAGTASVLERPLTGGSVPAAVLGRSQRDVLVVQ